MTLPNLKYLEQPGAELSYPFWKLLYIMHWQNEIGHKLWSIIDNFVFVLHVILFFLLFYSVHSASIAKQYTRNSMYGA